MSPLDATALDQIFRKARSYNGYRPLPVHPEELEAIWELMKFGPTSANMLPARMTWCVTEASKQQLAACASKTNAAKILAAPVTVIVAMDLAFHEHLPTLFPHTDARSWFTGNDRLREESAFRNSSLQGAYLIIAARAHGLDTGPMSGFDNAAVDRAFFAETPDIRSNFIITLGRGDPDTIFDRLPRPEFARFNSVV